MRADRVVVAAPAFDHDANLGERVEDFAVEKFIAQSRVEVHQLQILDQRQEGRISTDGVRPSRIYGA